MLTKVGVSSADELFRDVPAAAREPRFALPAHAGEMEVERILARLAAQNSAAGEVLHRRRIQPQRHRPAPRIVWPILPAKLASICHPVA
jgi:hypothetical protein